MSFRLRGAGVILAAFLAAFASFRVVSAGNTTCVGDHLDWYTSAVGETPCAFSTLASVRKSEHTPPEIGFTYQRLRQICNSDCEY